MVNITVFQNGTVIGDKGKIIGYEGQDYSEMIHIVFPQFSGCQYYIEYKYNQTIFKDKIDSNGHIKLKIEKGGRIQAQFVAIDSITGIPQFKSKSWDFIVHESLKTEACHYPCPPEYIHSNKHHHHSDHHGCCNHDSHGCGNNNNDCCNMLFEIKTELRNEEDIRFDNIQEINIRLDKIETMLGILEDPIARIVDANLLVTIGKWSADVGSFNFPTNTDRYKLDVSLFNDCDVLQNAYEVDSDNIWYRTGILDSLAGIYTWSEWCPVITIVESLD